MVNPAPSPPTPSPAHRTCISSYKSSSRKPSQHYSTTTSISQASPMPGTTSPHWHRRSSARTRCTIPERKYLSNQCSLVTAMCLPWTRPSVTGKHSAQRTPASTPQSSTQRAATSWRRTSPAASPLRKHATHTPTQPSAPPLNPSVNPA